MTGEDFEIKNPLGQAPWLSPGGVQPRWSDGITQVVTTQVSPEEPWRCPGTACDPPSNASFGLMAMMTICKQGPSSAIGRMFLHAIGFITL